MSSRQLTVLFFPAKTNGRGEEPQAIHVLARR